MIPARTSPDEGLRQEMLERLERRGVCDASGRRLSVSSQPGVVVIGKVCDAEPLLQTEGALARAASHHVLRGLGALALLQGAERVILAVDRAVDLSWPLEGTRLEVVEIAAAAPMDPISLVCDLAQAAGRSVPGAGLSSHSVHDAVVLRDVALALEGRWPSSRRFVTVAGAVARPAVVEAPLGTPLAELVELCGGATDPGWVPWLNGALGGRRSGWGDAVDLDTRGLVVLPHDHPIVVRSTTPLSDVVGRIVAACEGCRTCTDLCPVHLAGAHLEPHRVMQVLAASWTGAALPLDGPVLGALECTGCGLCSAACPSMLEPAMGLRALREQLGAQGVTLAAAAAPRPHPDRRGRRVSLARLVDMLGLAPYDAARLPSLHLVPERLLFPPRGPTGAARVPVVQPGGRVEVGDLLALSEGAAEVDLRAPLPARVLEVDPDDGLVLAVR